MTNGAAPANAARLLGASGLDAITQSGAKFGSGSGASAFTYDT